MAGGLFFRGGMGWGIRGIGLALLEIWGAGDVDGAVDWAGGGSDGAAANYSGGGRWWAGRVALALNRGRLRGAGGGGGGGGDGRLSLGYDMSHPLFAGILTSLDPERRGQAMGLNAFALFNGLGFGALGVWDDAGAWDWDGDGGVGGLQVVMGILAIGVFKGERAAQQG